MQVFWQVVMPDEALGMAMDMFDTMREDANQAQANWSSPFPAIPGASEDAGSMWSCQPGSQCGSDFNYE